MFFCNEKLLRNIILLFYTFISFYLVVHLIQITEMLIKGKFGDMCVYLVSKILLNIKKQSFFVNNLICFVQSAPLKCVKSSKITSHT